MIDPTERLARLRRKLAATDDPEDRADLEAAIAALDAITPPPTPTQTIGDYAQVSVAVAGSIYGNVYLDGRRADAAARLLAGYLARLRGRCASMPLEGMRQQQQVGDVLAISLNQVYTQLTVPGHEQREVYTGAALRKLNIADFIRQHTGDNVLPWQRRTYLRRPSTPDEYRQARQSARELAPPDLVLTGPGDPSAGWQEELLPTVNFDTFRKNVRVIDQVAFFGPRLVTDAIVEHSRLMLLGEPGSGKSTVLRYLALTLAEAGLDGSLDLAARLAGWERLGDQQRLLPIFLPLLPFAQRLAKERPHIADTDDLRRYIADQLEPGDVRTGLAEAVHAELAAGRVLLLLDGLDEVAGADSRQQVVSAVAQFAREYNQCRMVVTCRVRAYEGEQNRAWQLAGWDTATLEPWDRAQIYHFVAAWYNGAVQAGGLPGARRADRVAALQHAIAASDDLQRLADRPLLLTIMALVHLNDGRLPEDRVALYSRCIDILLGQWELRGKEASDYGALMAFIGLPDRDVQRLRPLLTRAAFMAHQASTADSIGRLDRATLRMMAADHLEQLGHPDPHRGAQKFLEYTDVRAGIIQATDAGDSYTFPHLTFQEYLAGLELTSGVGVVQRIIAHINDDRWHAPILLGIGDYVSSGKLEMPFQLLTELISQSEHITDQERRHLLFANMIVHNIGRERLLQGGKDFQRLLDDLAEALATLGGDSLTLSSEFVGQLEFSREWATYMESLFFSPTQSFSASQKILHRLTRVAKLAIIKEFVSTSDIPMFLLDRSSLIDSSVISSDLPIIVWPRLLPTNSNSMWAVIQSCIPARVGIACLLLPVHTRNNESIVDSLRKQADIDAVDLVILSRNDIERVLDAQNSNRVFLQLIINQLRLERMRLYQTEGAVEGRKFFGREHEIRFIRDQIATKSFILVGTRRIGKSSILHRLEENELTKASVLPIYVQTQDASRLNSESNYRLFIQRVCEASEITVGQPQRFDKIEDILNELPGNLMPVLLIDEADALLSAERQSGWRLFTELRQLSQSRRCQFVFAGEMAFRQVRLEADTPFYNFAEEIVVGRFDQSITSELFQRPMEQMGINITEPEQCAKLVYEFTGGHPNIIQRLCEQLVRLIDRRPIRELTYFDVKMITDNPTFQRDDFLNTYFQRTSPLEQLIVILLSRSQEPINRRMVSKELAALKISFSIDEIESALRTLVTMRQIVSYSQSGYQCAISGFTTVLGSSNLADDKLEELSAEHRKQKKSRRV